MAASSEPQPRRAESSAGPTLAPRLAWFQQARALATLNVIAVGAALAACTGDALAGFGPTTTALPTAVAGMMWAIALRSRSTVGKTRLLWGWLLSVPIAYANCAAAIFLTQFSGPANEFHLGLDGVSVLQALAMAIVGVLVWGPALVVTLVCFGLPIAWSKRLAKAGLEGAERGEAIVGVVCLALSVVAAFLVASGASILPTNDTTALALQHATPVLLTLAFVGAVAGGSATALAIVRGRLRHDLFVRAEAGRAPGYRVEVVPEGKRLWRVVENGSGYRVADLEEEVFVKPEATRFTAHVARRA